MAKRRGRKKTKRRRRPFRKLKNSGIYKLFKTFFAIVVLSGSVVMLYLVTSNLSHFLSEKEVEEVITVEEPNEVPKQVLGQEKEILLEIGLLSDSEGDIENLERAITRLKDRNIETAFFLGDLTRFGSIEELREVKRVLDSSGINFIVIPGDHDLADSVSSGDIRGLKNFTEVFGEDSHIYEEKNVSFMLFNNSANFTKISDETLEWFDSNISNVDFVILSQPLYHPSNPRVMGQVDGDVVSTVREQARQLLSIVRRSDSVKAVIAADQHFFSKNTDPERGDLTHFVIGALVSNRESIRNLQSSRYAILKIFESGGYTVEEVVL